MRGRLGSWARRAGRHEYLLATLALTALLALFFNPLVRHDATFSTVENVQRNSYPWMGLHPEPPVPLVAQADQGTYIHPANVFLHRSLERDGQVPLWDPLAFGGHPYVSAAAYPPRLILSLVLSPSWTHDIYLMVHFLVAGLGMFALMKQFGVRFAGALLGAVSWAFASYTFGWIALEVFASVAALLPLVILCVRRWHDRRSWRWLLVGGLLLGLLFLGTGKETALGSFLCVLGYTAALSVARLVRTWPSVSRAARLGLALAPVVIGGTALAVAAVDLLPFLDLVGRSQRLAAVPYSILVDTFAIPPSYFLRAFAPPDTPLTVHTLVAQQVFVGTATAVLAIVSLVLRRPGTGLGRWLLVLTFLFAVGTPVTWLGYHLVPGLESLNGFGRMFFLWGFGLAMLGGIGLDALLRARDEGRLLLKEQDPPEGASLGDDRLPLERWLRFSSFGRALPAALAGVVIVATAGQLLVYGRRANAPFQQREASVLFPETPALEAARAELGGTRPTGRVLPVSRPGLAPVLVGMAGLALDLPSMGGYEPVVPDNVSALLRVMEGVPPSTALNEKIVGTFATYFPPSSVRTDLLARVGVAAVMAPPDIGLEPGWDPETVIARGLRPVYSGRDGIVYSVTDRVPRAVFVTEAVWVGSEEDALLRFIDPAFDARRQVVLQGDSRLGGEVPSGNEVIGEPAEVVWRADEPNQVRLSVTSGEPGWLVLLDNWDPGWRASVGGRSTRVLRANFGFRAIRVPAGESSVTFSYRPAERVVGAWISILAVVAVSVLVLATSALSSRRSGRWRARFPASRSATEGQTGRRTQATTS